MPILRSGFSNTGSLIEDADRALHQLMVARVQENFGNAVPISWDGQATNDLLQLFSNAMTFFRLLHEQRSNAYVEAPDWSTEYTSSSRRFFGLYSVALRSKWQDHMAEDENGNEVKIIRWELEDDPEALGHRVDVSLFPGLYRFEETQGDQVSAVLFHGPIALLTLIFQKPRVVYVAKAKVLVSNKPWVPPANVRRPFDAKANAAYDQQYQASAQIPESPKVRFALDEQPVRSQRPVAEERQPHAHFSQGSAPASHKRAPFAAYAEDVEEGYEPSDASELDDPSMRPDEVLENDECEVFYEAEEYDEAEYYKEAEEYDEGKEYDEPLMQSTEVEEEL